MSRIPTITSFFTFIFRDLAHARGGGVIIFFSFNDKLHYYYLFTLIFGTTSMPCDRDHFPVLLVKLHTTNFSLLSFFETLSGGVKVYSNSARLDLTNNILNHYFFSSSGPAYAQEGPF